MDDSTIVREDGNRYIPASRRPDGTWRKARRVKDGYVPQEEVPLYESKGKQFAKAVPDHPIGLSPAQIERLRLARERNAGHESNPREVGNALIPGLDPARAVASIKKTAKKAAKGKQGEAVKKPAAENAADKNSKKPSPSALSLDVLRISDPVDPAKRLRNLRKKLNDIDALEARIKSKEISPSAEQLEKVSRRQQVVDEMEALEKQIFPKVVIMWGSSRTGGKKNKKGATRQSEPQLDPQELRRQQMLAAAEKRRSDELQRGLKNAGTADKLLKRRSDDEHPERRAGGEDGEPPLRWNVG
ncbi:unnamed protein product [Notodromas monacha]|uniref:Partner of Y14 and mago n=1 Tax=Notodromas monacha TaxID=399045 RepID=A0A7R9BTQ7_9CRUS|nr:unnamed protein product [Notodromas monacha]CAG0920031.1 unnamed protein product [Notodromas monacha]